MAWFGVMPGRIIYRVVKILSLTGGPTCVAVITTPKPINAQDKISKVSVSHMGIVLMPMFFNP